MSKNIALIFAGGVGSRIGEAAIPKQFLEVDSRPIIIHTLEKFERCTQIDAIIISMLEEYIPFMKELTIKHNISKVKWIVKGGSTGQLSIYNALHKLKNSTQVFDDSIVLIHDGVRPIIDNELIIQNINITRSKGSAITVVPSIETTFLSYNHVDIDQILDRKNLYIARAPQTFYLNDIFSAHEKELEKGNDNNIDSCSIMHKHDFKLSFVEGKSSNIKITTIEDFHIFEALYKMEEENE